MLKKYFFVFFVFSFWVNFSQTEIAFIKDGESVFTKETIKGAAFVKTNGIVNKGLDNGVYWFKMSNFSSDKQTIQVSNNRITEVLAYQNEKLILCKENERFITLEIDNKAILYLRLNVTREALIPIKVQETKQFLKEEKVNFLFLGFYYGFAFVVVVINLFYFINFKDLTFLYYSLFISSLCFGLSISDGLYNFFKFSERLIETAEVLDHFIVSIFAVLFASSYLQTENYYPKSKRNMFILALLVLVFGVIFLFSNNHFWYVILELLVFLVLIYCWTIGCLLFFENLFTKIFVIAYFFILLLGLSFYITKLLGIPIIISAQMLKFGAFFEMFVLSFAVVYRMKALQTENIIMRNKIMSHAKEIENLSGELQKITHTKNKKITDVDLTIREEEVFRFIVKGKSNKEIAVVLNISINTVKYHVKNIYDKLNVKSRQEVKNVIV